MKSFTMATQEPAPAGLTLSHIGGV